MVLFRWWMGPSGGGQLGGDMTTIGRRSRRRTAVSRIAVILAAVTLLVACGDDDTDADTAAAEEEFTGDGVDPALTTTTTTEATTTTTTEPEADEPVFEYGVAEFTSEPSPENPDEYRVTAVVWTEYVSGPSLWPGATDFEMPEFSVRYEDAFGDAEGPDWSENGVRREVPISEGDLDLAYGWTPGMVTKATYRFAVERERIDTAPGSSIGTITVNGPDGPVEAADGADLADVPERELPDDPLGPGDPFTLGNGLTVTVNSLQSTTLDNGEVLTDMLLTLRNDTDDVIDPMPMGQGLSVNFADGAQATAGLVLREPLYPGQSIEEVVTLDSRGGDLLAPDLTNLWIHLHTYSEESGPVEYDIVIP